MLLFKPEHIPLIKEGWKTQTRRLWKKPRAKVGSVHQMKTHLFGPSLGKLRIERVWRERLLDITEEGAKREGGYTRESFLKKWFEINPKSPKNPLVFVVDFRYLLLLEVA
jgi:hypothetical protein